MNIELLLKKFYNGVSTPEEELLLTEYFLNEENIDECWKEDQQLFRLLHNSKIHVPEGVSQRLEKSIVQMTSPPKVSQKIVQIKQKWYYWISSAAAVALLCIGLFFLTRKPTSTRMADTFSDPEKAALVAEQTLTFMSVQLNKGINKVADAGLELDKVNQLLNKHLNN